MGPLPRKTSQPSSSRGEQSMLIATNVHSAPGPHQAHPMHFGLWTPQLHLQCTVHAHNVSARFAVKNTEAQKNSRCRKWKATSRSRNLSSGSMLLTLRQNCWPVWWDAVYLLSVCSVLVNQRAKSTLWYIFRSQPLLALPKEYSFMLAALVKIMP